MGSNRCRHSPHLERGTTGRQPTGGRVSNHRRDDPPADRLESVSPRHWWTQSALRVSDRTALDLLADPGFDPQKELLIAQSDADSLGSAWEDDRMSFGIGGAASIVVERKGPAHLIFQIESDQPGLLFVSENYMPGWQALWTGMDRQSQPSPLPIARAHQAFLGLAVPAGSGTLELAYRPASVRWGLAISGASWNHTPVGTAQPSGCGPQTDLAASSAFGQKAQAHRFLNSVQEGEP